MSIETLLNQLLHESYTDKIVENVANSLDELDQQGQAIASIVQQPIDTGLQYGRTFKIQYDKAGQEHSRSKINEAASTGVYSFFYQGQCLKVGKASHNGRIESHYEFVPWGGSTLSQSLIFDDSMKKTLEDFGVNVDAYRKTYKFNDASDPEYDRLHNMKTAQEADKYSIEKGGTKTIGQWIVQNCDRYVVIASKENPRMNNFLEGVLQFKLQPKYEDDTSKLNVPGKQNARRRSELNIQKDEEGNVLNLVKEIRTKAKKLNISTGAVDKVLSNENKNSLNDVNCLFQIMEYLQTTSGGNKFVDLGGIKQRYIHTRNVKVANGDNINLFIRYTKHEVHVGIQYSKDNAKFTNDEIIAHEKAIRADIPDIKRSQHGTGWNEIGKLRFYLAIPILSTEELSTAELQEIEKAVKQLELEIK